MSDQPPDGFRPFADPDYEKWIDQDVANLVAATKENPKADRIEEFGAHYKGTAMAFRDVSLKHNNLVASYKNATEVFLTIADRPPRKEEAEFLDAIFGVPIHSYSRDQLLVFCAELRADVAHQQRRIVAQQKTIDTCCSRRPAAVIVRPPSAVPITEAEIAALLAEMKDPE